MKKSPHLVPIEFHYLDRRSGSRGEVETGETLADADCAVPAQLLSQIQAGNMRTTYRGRKFLKSPFDIALYLQLLMRTFPKTIIEIGTKEGGSALWFADTLSAAGREARVLSIDVEPPPPITDRRLTFLRGDARNLVAVLPADLLASLPHPWLVVEDSAHLFDTTLAVLDYFNSRLERGDYIVVEHGIVAFLPEVRYRSYQNGPNRAVAQFLSAHPNDYEIDRSLCDFYGRNVTWNTNGWLRRR